MSTSPIRILIADDHPIFRIGIETLFRACGEIDVIGEATTGGEAIAQAAELRPDVVVMDLEIPEIDGVEATRRILEQRPQTAILLMTDSGTESKIVTAVRAGALGYLDKDADRETFFAAVRKVHRGEPYLPPAITRRLLGELRPQAGPSVERLTERETEVLRLVAHGLDDLEIGEVLHIAPTTVRTHVSNLLGKLGLKNRVEATRYAVRHGLTSVEVDKG